MYKGLVLFDYDGTLVDERDGIYTPTDLTRRTIRQLQSMDYLCVLATGRALSYIPKAARTLGLDGFVASNGAYVMIHDQIIHHTVMDDDELSTLIQYMDERSINCFFETADYCYVKDMEEQAYQHMMQLYQLPRDGFTPYCDRSQINGKVEKITMYFSDRAMMKQCGQELAQTYECSYHRGSVSFDIAKRGVHKGAGAQTIIDTFQIPFEATYAFGDGDNDVDLLKTVNCGIAMRKHDPLLEAVADRICPTVKEEGIYQALKEMEVI